jgi:hypothetical protein
MAALVAFRKEFLEISKRVADELGMAMPRRASSYKPHSGLDPLRECMTIASACMKHYRLNHLPYNHLGIVPERSYQLADNQSILALKYFQWLEEKEGHKIRTSHSHKDSEKCFGPYKADGWIEEQRRVIEVNGCESNLCAYFCTQNVLRRMARLPQVFQK